MKQKTSQAFDVFLNGQIIDTVFWIFGITIGEVKHALTNHDGYNPSIVVKIGRPTTF